MPNPLINYHLVASLNMTRVFDVDSGFMIQICECSLDTRVPPIYTVSPQLSQNSLMWELNESLPQLVCINSLNVLRQELLSQFIIW